MAGPWAKRAVAGGSGGAAAARLKILSFALWRSWLRRGDAWRKLRHASPFEEHRAYRAFNRPDLATTRRPKSRERMVRAAAIACAVLIWVSGYVLIMRASPWPQIDTLKHMAAFPNCAFARLVGVAPAARGQPGYYEMHDRDRDGIACEPLPPPMPRVHRF